MAQAAIDQNYVKSTLGVSSVDHITTLPFLIDPITGRVLTDSASGSGTVTSVSVVTANGFAGTVATSTTTPAITLSTTITGVLKGNGTAISAATVGTDYSVGTSGLATGILKSTTGTGALSIAASGSDYVVPGPITTSGLTMSTAKILGRATAGTGAIEEIAETGTGSVVLATSPMLVTPVLGVATATSINKMAITVPATSSTLAVADGKTFTASNTLTLAGTDSTTMTFPSTSAMVARTDAAQTFTGTQTFNNAVIYTNNAIAASSNAATVPITARVNTVTNNSAATLTITMATASAVDGQLSMVRILDFSAVAQTIAWVNTENSSISAPTTSNSSTTLPLTVGFQYNGATSKWRCIASA